MENLIKSIKNSVKYWYLYLIIGVIFIVTGIWTLSKPINSYLALSVLFAISFLVSGIFSIISAIGGSRYTRNWGWNLAYGIIIFILGVYLVASPMASMATLALFVGFVALFFAFNSLVFAFEIKSYGIKKWGWLLAFGILSFLFAFLLIVNPVFAGLTVVVYTAFSFLSLGLFYIIYSIRLRKLKKVSNNISQDLKERYDALVKEIEDRLR